MHVSHSNLLHVIKLFPPLQFKTSTHSALHPIDKLLLIIKVNILPLVDARHWGHCIVGRVCGIQGNAKNHSIPNHH